MQALLAKLKSLSLPHEPITHKAVMTVEEQVEALQGHSGSVTKNLFLKDKKGRLYVVTALPDTKVDLKLLSARLGAGKGGIRMAPDELLTPILQVALGSVTPLAVTQPTATDVVLLLDQKLKSEASFFVHPLDNTASLPITAADLESYLKSAGKEAIYVDFEATPKFDRDNPPDLKYISDAAKPVVGNDGEEGGAATAATFMRQDKKTDSGKDSEKAKADRAAVAAAYNVYVVTDSILAKILPALKITDEQSIDGDVMRQLKADIATDLNTLKNAAYSTGFKAAQGSVLASITGAHS